MSSRKVSVVLTALFALALLGTVIARAARQEEPKGMSEHATSMAGEVQHALIEPEDLKWAPGPPSLPPGAEAAILEGDPTKPGPFTARFRLPANYAIRPHFHPATEHVTVVEGSFSMGLGDTFDQSNGTALHEGGFAFMVAGLHHYAWAGDEGAILQIHGVGPWGITYLNADDDPRNQAGAK